MTIILGFDWYLLFLCFVFLEFNLQNHFMKYIRYSFLEITFVITSDYLLVSRET